MPCVSMSADNRLKLVSLIEAEPTAKIEIDLVGLQVRANDLALPVEIREGARDSLLNGMWDPLEELVGSSTAVDQVASNLFYT